jgi:hypothetical protein
VFVPNPRLTEDTGRNLPRSAKPRSWLQFARLAVTAASILLAVLIICLIAVPASTWRHPALDAQYNGFDANLLYVAPSGPTAVPGTVNVAQDQITITAVPKSHPTVHLLTTPLTFTASFDVAISSTSLNSVPLRIGLWSPSAGAGYFLLFDGTNGDSIRAQTITNGTGAQDLVGGTIVRSDILGQFFPGDIYRIVFHLDRASRTITARITSLSKPPVGTTPLDANLEVTSADAPALLAAFRPTLSMSAYAQSGVTQASIRNFVLLIPSQPSSVEETEKVQDGLATAIVNALLLAALALCAARAAMALLPRLTRRSLRSLSRPINAMATRARLSSVILLAVGCALYVLANMALFRVGSPQFDTVLAKTWSYVAMNSGVADLYYRPLVVTAAAASQGVPLHESVFPYGFSSAYYYLVSGWIYEIWLKSSGTGIADSFSLEILLKGINVLFALADALLVYLILRRIVRPVSARQSALLLLLNPAVVFVMSVWGSTETISLFFVLGSIWLAEEGRGLPAWLLLAAAAFTRPQMFVLAFLLGVLYTRKFGLGRSAVMVSWTVVITFIALGPFVMAISPSVPLDYVARTFTYHFQNGQTDPAFLGISPAAYSVWPLVLGYVSHAHGLARMWAPSTQPLANGITYGQLALDLSVGMVFVTAAMLFVSARLARTPGAYFPVLAFGMMGWLMVTPGVISRYFIYALVLVILSRRAFGAAYYIWAIVTLSAITLLTMYGHLASDFANAAATNTLNPLTNEVSRLIFTWFYDDRVITAGVLLNIFVLLLLGFYSFKGLLLSRTAIASPDGEPVAEAC